VITSEPIQTTESAGTDQSRSDNRASNHANGHGTLLRTRMADQAPKRLSKITYFYQQSGAISRRHATETSRSCVFW
jgi:hypothetical protein